VEDARPARQGEPLAVAFDRAGTGQRQEHRFIVGQAELVRPARRQAEHAQPGVGPAGLLRGDRQQPRLVGRGAGAQVMAGAHRLALLTAG
jgi:hypothetical protein